MSDLSLSFNRIEASNEILSRIRENSSRDKENAPILRENTAALYKTLVTLKKPERILEAGTSIGYSALVAALALDALNVDFRIDTIELYEEIANKARENFKSAGFTDKRINSIVGDSVEVFGCLEGKYDMILLDSSKSHYIDMLPDCKRLLKNGGILMADDVIFYGKTEELPENSPHKHRTIVSRLREFLENINNDSDFTAFLDPLDDGVLIAVYNGEKNEKG